MGNESEKSTDMRLVQSKTGTRVQYFIHAQDIASAEGKLDEIGPYYSAVEAFRGLTSKVAFEGATLALIRVPGLTELGTASEVAWYSWRLESENSPPTWEGNGFRFAGEFLNELGAELNRSAGGRDAFLKGTDRSLVLDLLRAEFYELLVGAAEGKETAQKRGTVQEVLAHLDSRRSSAGLNYAVYARDEPEQNVDGGKIEYCQYFEAVFCYEGVELGEVYLESKCHFEAGEWVVEAAKWPECVKGLTELRTVASSAPDPELYMIVDPATVKEREEAFSREKGRRDRTPAPEVSSEALQSPELRGPSR